MHSGSQMDSLGRTHVGEDSWNCQLFLEIHLAGSCLRDHGDAHKGQKSIPDSNRKAKIFFILFDIDI